MWRFAVLLALTSPGFADEPRRETIEVGKIVEREVGYAIGVVCDAPEIVGAEMKTAKSGDRNILVLTGKRAGKTLCRAGTDPNRASYVFEVVVVTPPKRPARR